MDTERYNRLIMPNRKYVERHCRTLESDPSLVQDLIQEVMCQAAESLDNMEHEELHAVRGWLKTITVRAQADLIKQRNPEGVTLVDIDNLPAEDRHFTIEDPQQDKKDMWEAIMLLPLKDRGCMVMKAKGYTAIEIAEITGLNAKQVEKRNQRSIIKIREILYEREQPINYGEGRTLPKGTHHWDTD